MTATEELMNKWMNRAPGYDCLICGDRANHDIALMNLYATRLCLDHANEFHEYAIKRGWVRKLSQLKKVRDANVIGFRGKIDQMKRVEESTRAVDMYNDKLYYECKKWMTNRIVEINEARDATARALAETPKTKYFEGKI